MIKRIGRKIFKYSLLVIWSVIIFFPLIILFVGSFKTYQEFHATHPMQLPESFLNLENYRRALQEGKMLRGFINTFILVLGGVGGSIVLGSMVAYVITRFDFKFKKLLLFSYLLISIVPLEIAQVGTFKLMHRLGLYNTYLAPILLYIGADVLMIYMYMNALNKIPKEIDRAMILEGASYYSIYIKIIFPLLKPATATVAMLKMVSIYNDFYIPYLYMPGEHMNTVSTSIYRFVGPYQVEWQVISAAIIMSIIPILVVFLLLQKYIYKGIISGSIK